MCASPRTSTIWGALLSAALYVHCAAPRSPVTAARVDQGLAPPALASEPAAVPSAAVPAAAVPSAAGASAAAARAGSSARYLGARRNFDGLLRGDWDTRSALLVVYNRSWQASIQRLLVYAHEDLPVYVLATPRDARSASFRRWFARVPFAGLVSMALDTPWIRDYGPFEVQSQAGISWLDLVYAPEDRPRDDAMPALLGEVFEAPRQAGAQFRLEGGGIISNGEGLCGITESSLQELGLDDASEDEWETFLETVGCRTLARLPQLPLEATGHVDMLAQFLSPSLVAIAAPTPDSPPDVQEALLGARQALAQAAEAEGRSLEFIELPLVNREDLYFSYVNGLRTPAHYFVPSYSRVEPALQALAHARLARALVGVQVVAVDADEMIENGGAIHCVTLGLKHPLLPRARPLARASRPRR